MSELIAISELEDVEEVWLNDDNSIGIIFSNLIFKTRKSLSERYPESFRSFSGVTYRNEKEYPLVGKIELWEGTAYCYASSDKYATDLKKDEEVRSRFLHYLAGDKRFDIENINDSLSIRVDRAKEAFFKNLGDIMIKKSVTYDYGFSFVKCTPIEDK